MLGWGQQTGCTPALIYELVRASGSLQDMVSQRQVLQRVSEGGITVKVFFFLDHRPAASRVCETKVPMLAYSPGG